MFTVQILGNSSAVPAFARHTSAQVVNYNDRYYLIDCGEGVQMQLQKYKIRFSRIDALFISHMHGDHVLGAPGLLSSLSIFERCTPLPVYAPKQFLEMLKMIFQHTDTVLRFEIEFHALEDFTPGEVVFQTDRLEVRGIPLTHHTFCRGFLFSEKNKRRKFDFFKAKELGIPKAYFHMLKLENDITLQDGRKVKADEVLLPRDHVLSYAYCSDTLPNEEMIPFIRDVTVLYHEATFMENLKARAVQTKHSTARDAGLAAKESQTKLLLIGHFSARYHDLLPLLDEARAVFPATELAMDGLVIDLKKDV